MKAKRRRYNNKNRAGTPSGIVKPSALAEAKKRPWQMQTLLTRGPRSGGIDSQQFEAGVEIVSTFRMITGHLGFRAQVLAEQRAVFQFLSEGNQRWSAKQTHLAETFGLWALHLKARLLVKPALIVGWVEDEGRIDVLVLGRALDLWAKVRDGGLTGPPSLVHRPLTFGSTSTS